MRHTLHHIDYASNLARFLWWYFEKLYQSIEYWGFDFNTLYCGQENKPKLVFKQWRQLWIAFLERSYHEVFLKSLKLYYFLCRVLLGFYKGLWTSSIDYCIVMVVQLKCGKYLMDFTHSSTVLLILNTVKVFLFISLVFLWFVILPNEKSIFFQKIYKIHCINSLNNYMQAIIFFKITETETKTQNVDKLIRLLMSNFTMLLVIMN